MLRTIERRVRPHFRSIFPRIGKKRKAFEYYGDGMGLRGKILSPLMDPAFTAAWQFAHDANLAGWRGTVPSIQWRALTCCWAAQNALALDGDFVECGVHTGILSMTVCRFLGFEKLDRQFYLYDTFAGIPSGALADEERALADNINARLYFDCFEMAIANFASFPNVTLVRGNLPESIGDTPARIAYLSIDLNSATYERQTIDVLWPRLVAGAVVVIDDYGFVGHEAQHRMWNAFAAEKGSAILALPTGQGLMLKS
ncbi:MAG: methyltransferase [Parvibaculum sp.]|nr:methyltransferase [Parvibaculum sp.]